MLLLSLLSSTVCRGAGLVDNPIVGDVIQYIDSTAAGAKWVASAYTQGRFPTSHSSPTPLQPPPKAEFVVNARVPGDLITDLQNAKLVGDPLFETNFLNATM